MSTSKLSSQKGLGLAFDRSGEPQLRHENSVETPGFVCGNPEMLRRMTWRVGYLRPTRPACDITSKILVRSSVVLVGRYQLARLPEAFYS